MLARVLHRLRLWYHRREIETSLEHYRERTGDDAGRTQRYADTGSFRVQLDRLFALGTAAETAELRQIAESAVVLTLTNKFYRAADFLSDIVGALEERTFLTGEPHGEPPLRELELHERKLKLKWTQEAFLVPVKVASLENVLQAHARLIGRRLPYRALARFERACARVYALIDPSEARFVEQRMIVFLEAWKGQAPLHARFPEPVEGILELARCLGGDIRPQGSSALRVRRAGQPFRLSTLVPEDRQHLLRAAFENLMEPSTQ